MTNKEYLELLKEDVKRLSDEYDAKRTAERVIFQNEKIKLIDCENLNRDKVLCVKCENTIEKEVLITFLKQIGAKIKGEKLRDTLPKLVDLYVQDDELFASYYLWSPIETNGYIREKRALTFKDFKKYISVDIKLVIQKIQRSIIMGGK